MGFDYTQASFADALRKAGLRKGDVVFSHSNVGYFGAPEGGASKDVIFKTIYGAFRDVIGEEGTLVVPTFTFAFCNGQPYDPDNTPSECGLFTEIFRKHPQALRSLDPIFSIAAIGPLARKLTENASVECVGKDSFFERFFKADGVICNLNFDAGSTFIHYVEWALKVPYHFDKEFHGILVQKGKSKRISAIYYCRDLHFPETLPAFEPFDREARKQGIVRTASVGRGEIVLLTAKDAFQLIEKQLKVDPLFLTAGAGSGKRIVLPAFKPPMRVQQVASGTRVEGAIVPEAWICHEGYLETLTGQRVFSYVDQPLHVASYSKPFEGEVTRETLFQHLFTDPKNPDAIPMKSFCDDVRDWGFCCSETAKARLTEDRYRVVIKSEYRCAWMEFKNGTWRLAA